MTHGQQVTTSDDGSAAGSPGARGSGARDAVRLAVVVAALGVVFGDIGTSPIYTLQTVFNPSDPHPVAVSTENVFGVVSLVFWSVMINGARRCGWGPSPSPATGCLRRRGSARKRQAAGGLPDRLRCIARWRIKGPYGAPRGLRRRSGAARRAP